MCAIAVRESETLLVHRPLDGQDRVGEGEMLGGGEG